MMGLPVSGKILFFTLPTDMRKSFCGLAGLVRNELGGDPTDGTLFLFVNRRRDRIKALYWDRDGLALWYKRLESGTFEMFQADEQTNAIQIDQTDLSLLLGGISIESAKKAGAILVGEHPDVTNSTGSTDPYIEEADTEGPGLF